MRKSTIGITAMLFFGILVLPGHGDEPKKEPGKKVPQLMRRKLDNSHNILDGIATNDFDRIAKSADELIQVSKEAEWRVLKTDKYEVYSNEFRRNAEALIKNAKDKNTDAVALTYVELTLTCVRCHKHIRESRQTSIEDILPPGTP